MWLAHAEERKPTHKNGKPICRYGEACYRVNPDHLRQFWHPPKKNKSGSDGEGGAAGRKPGHAGMPRKWTPKMPEMRDDEDDISEEEGQTSKADDMEGNVRALSAMSRFRDLDPGVIRDVLEANDGSMHRTMEALKRLVEEIADE